MKKLVRISENPAREVGRSTLCPHNPGRKTIELATVYPNGSLSWCEAIKGVIKTARNRASLAKGTDKEAAVKEKLRQHLLHGNPEGVTSVTKERNGEAVVVYSLNYPVTYADFVRAALGRKSE